MPVDHRTHQQLGMLHGGASASLAEMTGSMAAYLSIDGKIFIVLGLN
jgi:1,4-dihydroxy-2-naphthoyl-CoA hydrolase